MLLKHIKQHRKRVKNHYLGDANSIYPNSKYNYSSLETLLSDLLIDLVSVCDSFLLKCTGKPFEKEQSQRFTAIPVVRLLVLRESKS